MTYIQWILYIFLVIALGVLVLLLLRLYKLSLEMEKFIFNAEETIKTLNNDLPVIMENLRDVSEEAKETSRLTRVAIKKAKDQILWLNMIKEAVSMFLKFKKKGGKNE